MGALSAASAEDEAAAQSAAKSDVRNPSLNLVTTPPGASDHHYTKAVTCLLVTSFYSHEHHGPRAVVSGSNPC